MSLLDATLTAITPVSAEALAAAYSMHHSRLATLLHEPARTEAL